MGSRGTESFATAAGVDAGSTLTKIALRDTQGGLELRILPSSNVDAVLALVRESRAARVGLTGGGGNSLAEDLANPHEVDEFSAWARGAEELLADETRAAPPRHLLVSIGTGTSVLLADGATVSRVGGTALGGGTLLGLGAALLGGAVEFAELVELAARGSRGGVDLLVGDVYGDRVPAMLRGFTASSFGRLARESRAEQPSREDVALGLIGLVGENVGLLCAAHAAAQDVGEVIYGGTALRDNAPLVAILQATTAFHGKSFRLLPRGEFAGAIGALTLAEGEG